MSEHAETGSKKLSRLKKAAAIMAGLIVLYAIVGFLIVPPIIKSQMEKSISERLNAQATVTDVAMNPFALSATVKGFRLTDSAGELFAGFEELYVNFQLSSLFRWAYTFSEIRFTEPEGFIKIQPDGTLNWATLVPPTKSQQAETDVETELVPVVIHELNIENARLDFTDLSRPTSFEESVFPINISLKNFTTQRERHGLHNFTASLGKGGTLSWEGTVSVNPIRSRGSIAMQGLIVRTLWEYISDQVNFEVTDGSMDMTAQYDVGVEGNDIMIYLGEGTLKLMGFILTEKGGTEPIMSVPLVDCRGIAVNYPANEVSIESISTVDAKIVGWRSRDGNLNYQALFAPSPAKTRESLSPTVSNGKTPPQKEWLIDVHDLSLKNYSVYFEDRTQATPVHINLDPISLSIKKASNRKDTKAEIALGMTVNETGTVEVDGTVGMNPQIADLAIKVTTLALRPFQQYAGTFAKIAVIRGTAGIDGRVRFDAVTPDNSEMSYRGNFRIDELQVNDPMRSEDILKWKSLTLNNIAVDMQPMKVSIAEIAAVQPYIRVAVWQDGTTNLARVIVPKEDTEETADADQPAGKPAGVESASGQEAMPVKIDIIRIKNGSMNFSDYSLKPNFATGIQRLNGTIKGLSSDPAARADVALEGAVDRYAPVKITGKINPLSLSKYADVTLSFKNMELASLTPYSGKFAGYKIDKGKMSLDFSYKILGNHLNGENRIFLNQLTLGERVDSSDALNLPIRLAIALLKDRAGNIDIDLPVQGDLADPEFSYGRLIGRALVNLLTRIVTAPFAALAGLVGGGEELSYIEFAYGDAGLPPQQVEKLDTLAKALYERPAVKLEIRGTAEREADRAALAEKALVRHLRELKAEELQKAKKESSRFS